ncbi:MAG: CopG family transcriptional regulator [Candidatus Zixiibacteriota bacterium]
MRKQKTEIITFKVDEAISAALKDVPNKSEFIRSAVTAALASTCPLCQGAGYLSPSQKEHWDTFARNHTVQECNECHERHLICGKVSKLEKANK